MAFKIVPGRRNPGLAPPSALESPESAFSTPQSSPPPSPPTPLPSRTQGCSLPRSHTESEVAGVHGAPTSCVAPKPLPRGRQSEERVTPTKTPGDQSRASRKGEGGPRGQPTRPEAQRCPQGCAQGPTGKIQKLQLHVSNLETEQTLHSITPLLGTHIKEIIGDTYKNVNIRKFTIVS